VKKILQFFGEVKTELGKVSWSTREEVFGSTMVVIVLTAFMAVFIGVIDLLLSRGLSLLFR
jgi:preprotein translocase subunit SecE